MYAISLVSLDLTVSLNAHFLYSRHNQVSDLHKQNLEQWRQENGVTASASASALGASGGQQYRDRAKERRQKYGLDEDAPKANKLKENAELLIY